MRIYVVSVCVCVRVRVYVRLPEFKAGMRLHTSTAFLPARCRVDSRVVVLSRRTGTCRVRVLSTEVFLATNDCHVTGRDGRKALKERRSDPDDEEADSARGKTTETKRCVAEHCLANISGGRISFAYLGVFLLLPPLSLPLPRPNPFLGPPHGRPVSLWVSGIALTIPDANITIPIANANFDFAMLLLIPRQVP